jgi:hopanoid C-2 methylase
MPPQGLLLIAAILPSQWDVRFVDENDRHVSDEDLAWADVVFITGMHVQRGRIDRINARAHEQGKLTVLGGPSVSGCPAYYPDVDVLHVGELGDATDELLQMIDASVQRPKRQQVLTTRERLPMSQFPIPAYHLLDLRKYFLGSIQFSSGCPFMCEFCDIPALYGRNPRLKSPERICQELDAMRAAGLRGAVYFVDDNFVANPKAARDLLPALIEWQERRGYPLRFTCEATLNLAQMPDLLEMMRQASFTTVFCGIETPEAEALAAMRKKQNLRQPILDSVKTFNDHGMEVVSGIILGLDTDTPHTGERIVDFIEASQIPLLTINLLYALPRTALHDRLRAQGRLIDDPKRESNVEFKLPYETVRGMWRRCVDAAYDPARLYERFRHQAEHTYPNRVQPRRTVRAADVAMGVNVMSRVAWHVGVNADYRHLFWDTARPLIRQGRIEDVIHIGVVAHHLIRYARDTRGDAAEACFYADPNRWATA